MIEIPPAFDTTETALKAMVFLWKLQRERTCLFVNNDPSSRDDGLIRKAYKRYRERLVVNEEIKGSTCQGTLLCTRVLNGIGMNSEKTRTLSMSPQHSSHVRVMNLLTLNPTGTCLVRDPYTERQLIAMLAFTWRQQAPFPPPLEPGVKPRNAYDNSTRFPHIREHFCLTVRHNMILRDEDLQHLNLADVFSVDRTRSVRGSKRDLRLCFCIHRGKTNPTGKKMYAAAFRHKNFLPCPVGAFAFYMLERFHVSNVLL